MYYINTKTYRIKIVIQVDIKPQVTYFPKTVVLS